MLKTPHISNVCTKTHPIRVNSLMPGRNRRHFADAIFIFILLDENISISIKISRKFIIKGPIKNNPALVQIMAWRRPGDKPLSEPMVVSLRTHICVARLQSVNSTITHSLAQNRPYACDISSVKSEI